MNTSLNADDLKKVVKEKYTQVVEEAQEKGGSCCSPGCGCTTDSNISMSEDYSKVSGYVPAADLGLGCGLPTEFAQIKTGDVVVDLGSGAGNDAFVARSIAGAEGKVIGVDFTEKMIERARANAEKLGFNNVEFRYGDIENLPVNDNVANVVVSNCVLNLVPDKGRAFAETFRILKPGGHFSVSDIVVKGELPSELRASVALYAGCVSGAIKKEEYLDIVKAAGFINITVQKERKISVPDEVLSAYLSEKEVESFKSGAMGIYSITVYAEKPSGENGTEEKKTSSEKKAKEKTWWDPGCCN
jgi:arsenite methyltransferase